MALSSVKEEMIEALAIGGAILGGGGGGSMESGKETAEAAFEFGEPKLVSIDALADDDLVVTVSAVGAPAAVDKFVKPEDYKRVIELIIEDLPKKPAALITNEMGGGSTFNAFIAAAALDIPMLDAACNGRAHPLGTMGSMGLSEQEDFVTRQVCVGGNPDQHLYLELSTSGSVQQTSALVRVGAVQAGGLVVVARNPVTAAYIRENAADGSLTQALEVGEAFLEGKTAEEKVTNVVDYLGGKIVVSGKIDAFTLETVGGLDVGKIDMHANGSSFEMTIWNEYMSLNENGKRINTFPDLLMTFDAESGLPLTSAHLKEGQSIIIISVPKEQLILGSGMFEKSGYEAIEKAVNIEMISYVSDIIK